MHTHRVAAVAYLINDGRFLLMKRNNFPKIWGPPGGRLEKDEHPESGLRREIREESGLEIEIINVVDIWHGDFGQGTYISLDYLVLSKGADVRLSAEHDDYCWVTLKELREGKPVLARSEPGFTIPDFERAWSLYLMFEQNGYIIDNKFRTTN